MTTVFPRLLLCLLLCAALVAAFADDAVMPTQSDIAILPLPTLAMNADTAKAAWDVAHDLFALKGYHVTGYAETLAAMAKAEVTPIRLGGVTPAGDPTTLTWWRNGADAAEDAAAVKALCAELKVSRVITLAPIATDAARKAMPMARDAKGLCVTLVVAAWGANTGRCVWETVQSFSSEGKLPVTFEGIFGEARSKGMRSVAALPEVYANAVVNTFAEFFQRDWAVYGTCNDDVAMTAVTGAVQKTKRGKADSILLTWTAPSGATVAGYAIYRAVGDDLFPAYTGSTTKELKFVDKNIDEESRDAYRYIVVPITADGSEGKASDVVSVSVK
jgi:hypothetical protein